MYRDQGNRVPDFYDQIFQMNIKLLLKVLITPMGLGHQRTMSQPNSSESSSRRFYFYKLR